jgi:hypothetical protein
MARNLSNKPHPTPHPDQPHAIGPAKERHSTSSKPPSDESQSDEPTYDSCFDDLNRLLSPPNSEPDPNLESDPPGVPSSPSSQVDSSVDSSASNGEKPPRTSEVFQAVGPLVIDAPGAAHGRDARSWPNVTGDERKLIRGGLAAKQLLETDGRSDDQVEGTRTTDIDDEPSRSPFPWTHLLLLTYSSALTMAMTWMIWQGGLRRPPRPEPDQAEASDVDATTITRPTEPVGTIPPIPSENITTLGKSVRLGELEVTPLSIILMPLTLVRSIEPSTERRIEESSLVMKLKLSNLSKVHAFTPLESAFLRDPISPRDRSYLETVTGGKIRPYPLALDSEWSILGQEFPELKPGESLETIIASEPSTPDRFASEMTWRVRLRIGSYRTDVLGVRFTDKDVQSASHADVPGDQENR